MNFSQLLNQVKKKSLHKIYLGAIMSICFLTITMVSGATNVHADTWSATLPSMTREQRVRNYVHGSGVQSKISLTRIVNGPSYYVKAQMFNSDGQPRTGKMLVKQNAGYKVFSNNSMSVNYRYTLYVSNEHFETTARSAYGYIQV